MLGTLKDEHQCRLIPTRDTLRKYDRWTAVMYDHDPADFVPVESQLRDDFFRVCSALQDFWTQVEKLSNELLHNAEFKKDRALSLLRWKNEISPHRQKLVCIRYSVRPGLCIRIIRRYKSTGLRA